MARGYLKEKEYRLTDIRHYIKNKMQDEKVRQWQIADALGISQPRVAQKIKTGDFNIAELLTLFKLLGSTEDEVGKMFIL